MEISGLCLGRRRGADLERLLADAGRGALSYEHVGSSLRQGSPPGVPDRRSSLEVDGDLGVAASTLRAWAPHDGIRARILPPGARLQLGTTVLVVAPFGPFEMAVPNRVVAIIDDGDRYGFAYGTLPGHAEAGEESFVAQQIAPSRLRLTVRVHARPATRAARLGAPVVRLIQQAAIRQYLAAWSAAISCGSS